ncbi:MAG TPA: hypothetical protein VGL02_05025 [Streptomyces sp.]
MTPQPDANAPTPAQIKDAVAHVGRTAAETIAGVPDAVLTADASATQQGAVAVLRVLLTGTDQIIRALTTADDARIREAVDAVAAQPVLGDLVRHQGPADGA